ncbi:MAG: hypothetical protein HA496_04985 [Thaumarchaeota archaeon]|jgi:hypothetical protein|nr:hypothetical protein [Nitrososphaerota archaeon]
MEEERKEVELPETEKKREMMRHSEDVEELREVLKTVREEVPGLLKDIVGPLKELMGTSLTEEQAKERARAIATFYKELVAAGMKEDVAIELVKNQFISPAELIKNLLGQAGRIRREEEKVLEK